MYHHVFMYEGRDKNTNYKMVQLNIYQTHTKV